MKSVLIMCVLCAAVSSAYALDREAFTFTKYDLEVRVEPEQQRLGVRGKITLRNDSASAQASLPLQISSSLNWSSIQFEGKPVEFVSQTLTSDIDHTGALSEAIVVLPRPVAPKQVVDLEIGYEGVIPLDTTRLTRMGVPADAAKHSDWDQIGRTFSAVRGIGYVAWYPVATEAANLTEGDSVFEAVERWKRKEAEAEFDVYSCALQPLSEQAQTTATLVLMNEPPHSEGRGGGSDGTSCTGHPYHPLGMLVPVLVAGNYVALSRPEVDIYSVSDHKSGAEDYAAAAEEVAPLVTRWFGDHRAKPELKAEVVDLPDTDATPFESGNMLLMPLTGSDTKFLLAAAEQLTHVEFPSPRSWIRDGLSRYAQAKLVQEKEGRAAAIQYLQSHRNALVESEKRLSSEKEKAEANSLLSSTDDLYVQTKAMSVWWMLRDMVGEDALTAALQNYKAADDNDASYAEKLIGAQAHRDLKWFFDDWLYHDRGLPDFRIASVYPSALPNGGYMVTVTVENLGDAGAEVPVTLHMQTGEASQRLTVRGKSKASVRIQAASLPQEATVNDGSVPERDITNNSYKIESVSR